MLGVHRTSHTSMRPASKKSPPASGTRRELMTTSRWKGGSCWARGCEATTIRPMRRMICRASESRALSLLTSPSLFLAIHPKPAPTPTPSKQASTRSTQAQSTWDQICNSCHLLPSRTARICIYSSCVLEMLTAVLARQKKTRSWLSRSRCCH